MTGRAYELSCGDCGDWWATVPDQSILSRFTSECKYSRTLSSGFCSDLQVVLERQVPSLLSALGMLLVMAATIWVMLRKPKTKDKPSLPQPLDHPKQDAISTVQFIASTAAWISWIAQE